MQCRKCHRETPPDALYCPYCGVSLNPNKYTRRPRTRPNGTGTAFKRGNTWTARVVVGWKYRDDDTSTPIWRTKGGFLKKKDALNYCQTLLKSQKEAKVRLSMRQIYDAWLPTHETKVGRSTMDCYRAAWKYYLPIHDLTFADIDLDDLQECIDDCPRGKRTKENMKAIASLLMKYAIPRHQTDMNYAEFLYTGNGAKGTRPAFTPEHIERIRQQIGITPHAEDVYCMCYTGFRTAEFVALRKENYIDGILYQGIKTEAGFDRAVPVSDKIKPYIDARMSGSSEYLFPKDDGSRMSASYFREVYFYKVLDAAGIQPLPTKDRPAYYVPYSARHAFANMLKDVSGADKDKAGLIGHEDYKTTKRHYQSVEIDALRAIIRQI